MIKSMEWTTGKIMSLLAFLFGLAVAGYFIFRPKVVNRDITIDGSGMDDDNQGVNRS